MNMLREFTRRLFLITENVRDEIILSDNSCVQLDQYLHIYLKNHLAYDSVVFLDARGVYYFDGQSRDILCGGSTTGSVKKNLSKLKRHKNRITMKPAPETRAAQTNRRLRYTYDGDIVEISQFIISHLRNTDVQFAFVIYDGTLFEKLPSGSDVWIQVQGMLRNEIFTLPSSCRNILLWVDGEEYLTLSQRFQRLGLDFLFALRENQPKPLGKARIIATPTAAKDEIMRAMALHALKTQHFPPFQTLTQSSPMIAGAVRQRGEMLKTFRQNLRERPLFMSHIQGCYGLKPEERGAYEQLNEMIGLDPVKETIKRLVNGIEKKERVFEPDYPLTPERFKSIKETSLPHIPHLALLGNPGTGKTVVARLIGQILKEEGILEAGHLVEVTREALVAGYLGQTAIKTRQQVERALDGILFLDEAYLLVEGEQDSFGKEALGELIKAMSDYQGRFMMIFAGYKRETLAMLAHNPGSDRRIEKIDFPDYSADELSRIMLQILKRGDMPTEPAVIGKSPIYCHNLLAKRKWFGGNHFGNAGVVVKHIETARQKARAHSTLTLDVAHFERPELFDPLAGEEDDLDKLIGLENIKEQLRILFRRAKVEKISPGHYLFLGNPGTGKTIVARQMARKFYEMGLLTSAKLNHYTASELISGYVGGTENRLKKILDESLGGVLFIDEAHQLADDGHSISYGEKALDTILPFMEDRRKEFSLIFAGYPSKMEGLFRHDPGLKGRFNYELTFDDYSAQELALIFFKMFENPTSYDINGIEKGHLVDAFEKIRLIMGPYFSNGRAVREFINRLKNKAVAEVASNQLKVKISPSHIEKVVQEWT